LDTSNTTWTPESVNWQLGSINELPADLGTPSCRATTTLFYDSIYPLETRRQQMQSTNMNGRGFTDFDQLILTVDRTNYGTTKLTCLQAIRRLERPFSGIIDYVYVREDASPRIIFALSTGGMEQPMLMLAFSFYSNNTKCNHNAYTKINLRDDLAYGDADRPDILTKFIGNYLGSIISYR
jgi:hypothetical protein